MGDGQTAYVSKWGNYAAISNGRELVAKAPEKMLAVDGPAAKELADKDVSFFVNVERVRRMALANLKENHDKYVKNMSDNMSGKNAPFGGAGGNGPRRGRGNRPGQP